MDIIARVRFDMTGNQNKIRKEAVLFSKKEPKNF
jgi:hypothetical protein